MDVTSNKPYAVLVSEDEKSLIVESIYAWNWSDDEKMFIGLCADELGLTPCTELEGYVGIASGPESAWRKYSSCARNSEGVSVIAG